MPDDYTLDTSAYNGDITKLKSCRKWSLGNLFASLVGVGTIGSFFFFGSNWAGRTNVEKVFLFVPLFFFGLAAFLSLKQQLLVQKYNEKFEQLKKDLGAKTFTNNSHAMRRFENKWDEAMKKADLLFSNNMVFLGAGILLRHLPSPSQ